MFAECFSSVLLCQILGFHSFGVGGSATAIHRKDGVSD